MARTSINFASSELLAALASSNNKSVSKEASDKSKKIVVERSTGKTISTFSCTKLQNIDEF